MAYLDETFQAPGDGVPAFYVFTAVLVERAEMPELREGLQEIAGGTFWHTTNELLDEEGRKRTLSMLEYLGQGTEVCVLAHQSKVEDLDADVEQARRACLRGLLAALSAGGPAWDQIDLVIFEERTPMHRANFDRRHVKELRKEGHIHRSMQVQMVSPRHETLLWLPDLVSSAYRKSITGRRDQELLAPIRSRLHIIDPLT